MTGGKHDISIWFFIGSLMAFYGVLILGYGLYALSSPPERMPVLHELHADIGWGTILLAFGAAYCARFFPSRQR